MSYDRREYNTLEDETGGLDYRTIADMMTIDGDEMGHSTVRNVVMRVMERFAAALMAKYGVTGDPADVARGRSFQRLVALHIQEVDVQRKNLCDAN